MSGTYSHICDQKWLTRKLVVVEPPFIYVEPQLSGTGWEHFAWTQLLGFSNLVSHSCSIPGLGKFYHCFPWTR